MATEPITMIRRVGTVVLGTVLALAAVAAAPAPAAARSIPQSATFALTPVGASGGMLLHGTPGAVLHAAVRVRNTSAHEVTVLLEPADIQTASNGNASYVTTQPADSGRWLHLDSGKVRLRPRVSRQIAFTLSIPRTATGASHYVGIVAIDAADLNHAAGRSAATGKTFTFYQLNRQALPITVRLPGKLTRSLTLRSLRLDVQTGAQLVLDLQPGGSDLIQGARIALRVLRGNKPVFSYHSTLGQLFPGSPLSYTIPWPGHPVQGSYRILGTITPAGAAAITIHRTIEFTAAKASTLKRETPPPVTEATPQTPPWVYPALGAAALALVSLLLITWKLARRPSRVQDR